MFVTSDACDIIDIKPTYERAWRRTYAAAAQRYADESEAGAARAPSATDEQSEQDERAQPTVAANI